MAEVEEDDCERCGRHASGKRRWMFYRPLERFPQPPMVRQFFCDRCLRLMWVYAVIGFGLVWLLVGSLVGVTIWLTQF
ncbi:hypothetical protein [Algisphaera agarilytica]|uniref:Uncharacterized protein n=1 Tax=Algisphaera agarilytica TaxID=1385975 RepID=A0A7X0LLS0_9BACT|nr:hypothetical protein [Algisphaera agarilytica]MBB6430263.1 hypothetical protein [Algisphaera agarilytica]